MLLRAFTGLSSHQPISGLFSSPQGTRSSGLRSKQQTETLSKTVSNESDECHEERRRRHLASHFNTGDLDEAIPFAKHGEVLCLHPATTTRGGCLRACLRRLASRCDCCWRRRFVVVCDPPLAHSTAELRWDRDASRAGTLRARGRVLLSDVRFIAPTVMRDQLAGGCETRAQREFRVVCTDCTLRFRAGSRRSMRLWVTGLMHLSEEARGSTKRSGSPCGPGLKNYLRQFEGKGEQALQTGMRPHELKRVLEAMNLSVGEQHLRQLMGEFDADESGFLDLEEFHNLLQTLVVKDALRPWFLKYARTLPLRQTIANYAAAAIAQKQPSLEPIAEVQEGTSLEAPEAWSPASPPPRLAEDEPQLQVMSVEDFALFLLAEQGELVDANCFSDLSEPNVLEIEGELYLTEVGFSEVLCVDTNSVFDPARSAKPSQDMSQPLSHYLIATSHNTYLEGDQLVGESSVQQYIDVLLRGCRCVEIDCWDGDDGEPMVTHGWTATSSVRFEDVVRVCRDYGFVASPYPLILSLEVHCSPRQIGRMGQILAAVLGETLLRLPVCDLEAMELISPAAAKRKVIVKGKVPARIKEVWAAAFSSPDPEEGSVRYEDDLNELFCDDWPSEDENPKPSNQFSAPKIVCKKLVRRATKLIGSDPMKATLDNADGGDLAPRRKAKRIETNASWVSKNWTSREPRDYTTELLEYARTLYLIGAHRQKRKPKGKGPPPTSTSTPLLPCEVASIDERRASAMVTDRGASAVREHHWHHITRVYPRNTRVASTNFDPVPLWHAGFQLVALNYQCTDLANVVNEGLFRHENGGAGYVLKPPPERAFSPAGARSHPPSREATVLGLGGVLDIVVLSGHNLPKPPTKSASAVGIIDPVVRVSLCGAEGDKRTVTTRRIVDNGFNPRWEESFSFEVAQPALAVLALEVLHVHFDKRRKGEKQRGAPLVAAAAFPVSGFRQGLRWVPLLDFNHHSIDCCGLLLEVRFRGPWATSKKRPSPHITTVHCHQKTAVGAPPPQMLAIASEDDGIQLRTPLSQTCGTSAFMPRASACRLGARGSAQTSEAQAEAAARKAQAKSRVAHATRGLRPQGFQPTRI